MSNAVMKVISQDAAQVNPLLGDSFFGRCSIKHKCDVVKVPYKTVGSVWIWFILGL